ncbi:MAG: alanine racemase [Candidatus Aminicenantia bacterium]
MEKGIKEILSFPLRQSSLSWVEISSEALKNNVNVFRNLIGEERILCGVVKSNAYGHGILEVSSLFLSYGVDWLGVNSIEEGILLRRNRIKVPIIVLGYVPLNQLKLIFEYDLRMVVYNFETVRVLGEISNARSKEAYLHIKLETGTHRQGLYPEKVIEFIKEIRKFPYLKIEGISTHFANIEDTTDHSYAENQLRVFENSMKILERENINIPIRHTACTAATILFSKTYFEMVRVGIGLYGLWPSRETFVSSMINGKPPFELKPVLTWKTRIAQIKEVKKGSFIGYGCTYKTSRDSKIAVLPVGYNEGYDRKLSNLSYVLIKGYRAPLRGRVAMNMMMVDITDIEDVGLEEEVVLLGAQGKERITAEYLASLCGTINYEIVTRINPLIPRIVL